jgi:hypothetical protein
MTESILEDRRLFGELMEILKNGRDADKGVCADVMKHVTKADPAAALPFLDAIIGHVNHELPRVKWGVPESIGNMAETFPDQVKKAVPALLKNTADASTVVRWCAAFALSEIAVYNPKARKNLIPEIKKILKTEKNNGVGNVYLKAMKRIGE